MYKARGETAITECYPNHGYVIKRFVPRKPKFGQGHGPLRGSLELCFARELECLKRLHGEKNFPQLIDHNIGKLTITMSYVGRPFLHFADDDRTKYVKQVDNIITTLNKHHIKLAYELSPNDGKIGYMLSMMMVQHNELSIIDFERAWPVGFDKESELNDAFKLSYKYHDNQKFKLMLEKTIINTKKEPAPKDQYEEK